MAAPSETILAALHARRGCPIGVPSSACRKPNAICASLKFERFMENSLHQR
jgi:hypothetical protein